MGADAVYCRVIRAIGHDPSAQNLVAEAHALGIASLTGVRTAELTFIRGDLLASEVDQLVDALLADPLTTHIDSERPDVAEGVVAIEVVPRPGVCDPRASAIERGARLIGVSGVTGVATGRRYEISGPLSAADLQRLINRLLVNAVTERYHEGEIAPTFDVDTTSPPVGTVRIRGLEHAGLTALSLERALALDLEQMQAVQLHFDTLDRDPTDVEMEMIAQTWSEHCAHTTFRAAITLDDGSQVVPLIQQLRAATNQIDAPFVHSAFVDNAGIVAFDDQLDLAIKVETHNHPSAIEPFGGANTGVGGVVRDVLGVSARPIALTDILCFGDLDVSPDALPDGVLHPRRIRSGVIAGVADYGNKLGVPTVSGAIIHHPGYTANPLVYCGCVGVLPRGSHRTSPAPGDRIVVIGGRTGRDGIRGATFSSMEMDATTGDVAGASVQIGDPIVEKGLIDVVVEARDAGVYTALTDCGAGGLSSAVGEIAGTLGCDVDIAAVTRKYAGLAPWEVWLSEAQERMVLAVPEVGPLAAICDRYEVEWCDIGAFGSDGIIRVRDSGSLVLKLSGRFLHDGRPQRQLKAVVAPCPAPTSAAVPAVPIAAALLGLLAHPSIRSNRDVLLGYDHEVLGGSVVRPYTGACLDGPSDAAVFVPEGAKGIAAAALACGVNALFGSFDAYLMAEAVVDEAIRNVVAVGADPDRIVLLDNFSWGNPRRDTTLGALVEAVRGCCEASLRHRAPFVSGKDSLNNEFLASDGDRHSIPPTLVITALGVVPDLATAITSDLKSAGNRLILLGATRNELRGSHLFDVLGIDAPGEVPSVDLLAPVRYRQLHEAIKDGLVASCHDLSEGGMAVAVSEMAIGGRLGARVVIDGDPVVEMFSESNGRLLLEVAPHLVTQVLGRIDGAKVVGEVTTEQTVTFAGTLDTSIELADLFAAWSGHVPGASL